MDLIAALPVLVKLAFLVIDAFLVKFGQNSESREIMLKLAEALRRKGIAGVKSRFEAESQVQAGNDAWAEREKNEKDL